MTLVSLFQRIQLSTWASLEFDVRSARRIFAASARRNPIILEKLAKNLKIIRCQVNADTVIQKLKVRHPLSNPHSETYADSRDVLSWWIKLATKCLHADIHAVDLPVNNNVSLVLMRPVFHSIKNQRWDKKEMTIAPSAILMDFPKEHVSNLVADISSI
jgi:hypothetical protein